MNCGCCLELVRVIWCAFGVCVCLRLREGERDCVCVCERELCACVCMRGGGCVLTHVHMYAYMHACIYVRVNVLKTCSAVASSAVPAEHIVL